MADGAVQIKVSVLPPNDGDEVSVMGRVQNPGGASLDGYEATLSRRTGSTDQWRIWKVVNNVYTAIANLPTGPEVGLGDQIGLKMSGSTISLWRMPAGGSWTQLLTVNDSSVTGSGVVGIEMHGLTTRADDFYYGSDFRENQTGSSGLNCTATGAYCTNYTYNSADQLTGQTDPAGRSYGFFYDDRGNLRGTQYPNSTFSWTDTNPDGWTIDQLNRHGTINATTTTPPADASPIADYAYSYAPDGQKLTEQLTGPTSQTTTYTYDDIGRLATYSTPGVASAQYCYDRDSNRLQVTATSGTLCGDPGTPTYSYTAGPTFGVDELTSLGATTHYHYTSDGQLDCRGTTVGPPCPSGADSFRWDGHATISGATVGGKSVCYRYGPDGSLLTRIYDSSVSSTCTTATSTTNYLLGDLFETDAAGAVRTSYQDGPAGDLVSFTGPPTTASTPNYLYYNAHGDLAAEMTGSTIATHTYDPFGAPLDPPPAQATSHRYTAAWDKQDDTTTNLILMGARPYDPSLGRFLAVDPIDGGSLNSYDYAGQDPINGYDLEGTMLAADADGGAGCPTARCLVGAGVPGDPDLPDPGTAEAIGEGATRSGRAGLSVARLLEDPLEYEDASYLTARAEIARDARGAGWRSRPAANGRGVVWFDPRAPGVQIRVMKPSAGAPAGEWPSYYRLVVSSGRGAPVHVRLQWP